MKKKPEMPPLSRAAKRNIVLAATAAAGWLAFAAWYDYQAERAELEITYSAFMEKVDGRDVASVVFRGHATTGVMAHVTTSAGDLVRSQVPASEDLLKALREKGAEISFGPRQSGLLSLTGTVLSILVSISIPMILIAGLLMSSGHFLRLGRARRITPEKAGATFADVAGLDQAKAEMQEVIAYLRNPERFEQAGARVPKGVLLVGPPGNGKTLLARAAAGEAGVPFFASSGAEFVEMFVGLGAARVRSMFRAAHKNGKCILFIDEIDAVGGRRGTHNSHQEREQTLNQLLIEMDGIAGHADIIVIAATNRVDVLDPALIRPGRFDRHIHVELPDVAGRAAILAVHAGRLQLDPTVDLLALAGAASGFSGADLANLCNEAAIQAARQNRTVLTSIDFDHARDRVLLGSERPTLTVSDAERKVAAYHEAGHALVALELEGAERVHKATIVPRGQSLGAVIRIPEGDRVSLSAERLRAEIVVCLAGRAAEIEAFGDQAVTSGAGADLRVATELVERMVCEWGMGGATGLVSWARPEGPCFTGRRPSAQMEAQIDQSIRQELDEGMQRARAILEKHHKALERVATALLDRQTLTGGEIADIVAMQVDRQVDAGLAGNVQARALSSA